jgi:hypothetical protein
MGEPFKKLSLANARVRQLEAELTELKARTCGTCTFWEAATHTLCQCSLIDRVTAADFYCSRWFAREEASDG